MNALQHVIEKINDQNLWEQEMELRRNEYLKTSGSADTNLYYVVSGSLRIFVTHEEEEHTVRFAYRNELVTALDSFITGKASDFCIQAIKKTELKMIGKKSFKEFIESSAENKSHWLEILESLVFQQMERERDLLTSSSSERYRRVLERSPKLFQEIPHRHIASYLRMTPENLSRIKKS